MKIITAFRESGINHRSSPHRIIAGLQKRPPFVVEFHQDIDISASRSGRRDPWVDGQIHGAATGHE